MGGVGLARQDMTVTGLERHGVTQSGVGAVTGDAGVLPYRSRQQLDIHIQIELVELLVQSFPVLSQHLVKPVPRNLGVCPGDGEVQLASDSVA